MDLGKKLFPTIKTYDDLREDFHKQFIERREIMRHAIIISLIFLLFPLASISQVSGQVANDNVSDQSWINGLGSDRYDDASHVTTASDGSIYVVGSYCEGGQDDCNFRIESMDNSHSSLQGSDSCNEIFITKYSSNGDHLWSQSISNERNCGSGQQVANDIDITPSDGLVITGYYRYELVFGDGTEIDSLQSSVNENRWRGYVAQVDSDGEWEWAHQFGREGNDDSYANGVGVDPSNGDVYVVGVWEGTSNDWFQVDDEQKFRGHCGNYMESSFIVRFENDGTHRWSKEIEGYRAQGELYCDNNYRNELNDVEVDSSSNIYLLGIHRSNSDQGCIELDSTRICSQQTGSSWNIFGIKIDDRAYVEWGEIWGGDNNEYGHELEIGPNGEIVLRGYRDGGAFLFGDYPTTSGRREFVAQFNSTGDEQWIRDLAMCCYNHDKNEGGLSVGPEGKIYVVMKEEIETVSADGSRSISWDSDPEDDDGTDLRVNGIHVDDNGTMYQVGSIDGTLNLFNQLTLHGGNHDAWISKYYPDTDGDGIPDKDDNCNENENIDQSDYDNDGIGDLCDDDNDNDSIVDQYDDCPEGEIGWTSTKSTDFDNDGCKDSSEDDNDDNDRVTDFNDRCDPETNTGDHLYLESGYSEWEIGWDGDDYDNDGCRDGYPEEQDSDNDGVIDSDDRCKMGTLDWLSNFIPGIGEVTDHDGDGCKDRSDEDFDRDNDGLNDYPVLESLDACPMGQVGMISSKETDYDGDGCLDSNLNGEDRDDDNDAVDSVADQCPKGSLGWTSTEVTDHDRDGCRDIDEDSDKDNDGIQNSDDFCPTGVIFNSNSMTDHDGDGCRDSLEDMDDDGDGILDGDDFCPLGETGWTSGKVLDSDGDGCKDESEGIDSDRDGVSDTSDSCPNQEVDRETMTDEDGDGCWQSIDGNGTNDQTPDNSDPTLNQNTTIGIEQNDGNNDEQTESNQAGVGSITLSNELLVIVAILVTILIALVLVSMLRPNRGNKRKNVWVDPTNLLFDDAPPPPVVSPPIQTDSNLPPPPSSNESQQQVNMYNQGGYQDWDPKNP